MFYEALQRADLERLMALWSDEDDVSCVHPGGPRLVGHAAIRAAFETLFRPRADQRSSGARAQAAPRRSGHPSGAGARAGCRSQGEAQTAWVIASNVYLKTPLGWRMVLHHASPGSATDVQELSEGPATLH